MKHATLSVLVATLLLAGLPAPTVAATELQFWHATTGTTGERVNEMVARFNASQRDYVVKAVHKGTYQETIDAVRAADRAKQSPHIVHIAERGTQPMLSSAAVYPVHQLMRDHGIAIDWADLIGPIRSYYSTGGNLSALSFNAATAILYYNKDHFRRAGLPDKAPTTWEEVEAMARKLQAAGVKCPFGSAWPSFLLAENMHAYHDQPFTDQSNGFDGLATSLKINGPFGVKLMTLLARGAREGWFIYGGRQNKAEALMSAGECGIFTSSSVYGESLRRAAEGKFTWATGFLPRLAGFPQGNSTIGGGALWVMKGGKPEEYRGVAQFLKHVASTENQAWWASVTGYLPLTNAAAKVMEASGHYAKSPHLKTAVDQMNAGQKTPNSQGIRFGRSHFIRDAIEEEMEHIFSGSKTPQEGLDEAVRKGNELLKAFAAQTDW